MEKVNPLMPALPPESPMVQEGSAEDDDGITMENTKSPRIVMDMFLIDDPAVVDLISVSPFFDNKDGQRGCIVYQLL
jgi:hypothetical protein